MRPTERASTITEATAGFNYNKLQAAACMLASAAVSIGLTWFAVSRLF